MRSVYLCCLDNFAATDKMAEPQFVKYTPQKDLPEEIKTLPRNETVCKFCGVSYLVHHEIKALEDRVSELEGYRDKCIELNSAQERLTNRVNELEEELCARRNDVVKHEAWLSDRDRQLIQVRHTSELIRSQLSSKEESLALAHAECTEMSQQLETLRSQMCSLSKASKGVVSVVKACHLRSTVDDMRQTVCGLESFMKEYSSSILKFVHEWDRTAAAQRAGLKAHLHREQECSREIQKSLNTCRTEMKEKIQELTITISSITEKLDRENDRNSQLSSENNELRESLRVALHNYQTLERCTEEDKRKHEVLVGRMKEELCCAQSSSDVSNEQTARLDAMLAKEKRDGKNVQQAMEREMASLREQLDTLEKLKQAEEKEAAHSRLALEHKLKIQERTWQEELRTSETKHSRQLQDIQRELLSSHVQEVTDLQARHAGELAGCKADYDSSVQQLQRQYKREMQQMEADLRNARSGDSVLVQQLKEELDQERASSEAELLAHIRQVKDLELRLKARGDEERAVADEWRAREEGLRAEVDQLVCRVEEMKGKVEEKELQCRKVQGELDEARTEVCHLQETVHRECEERLELQESLSQAREQLHALRRLGSGGSERGGVPHQPKSSMPGDSLEESRQRIANATRRSSRPSSRSLPRL